MYGALADVLGMESEATGGRPTRCLLHGTVHADARNDEGIKLVTPDLHQRRSEYNKFLAEMDSLAVGWQESQQNLPALVQAGMDISSPVPGSGQLVTLQLLGNAPLLDVTNTYVQCSRDDWEAVLTYAQHLASLK